jgi:hypothetical protein
MTKNLRNLSASVNLKEIGDVVGVYGVIGYEQNIYNGASSLPITDCTISISPVSYFYFWAYHEPADPECLSLQDT